MEVFQYFIISENDLFIAGLLNEPVFYNTENDLYLLGITHFGTGWDYVLTDINLTWTNEAKPENRRLTLDFEQIQELI